MTRFRRAALSLAVLSALSISCAFAQTPSTDSQPASETLFTQPAQMPGEAPSSSAADSETAAPSTPTDTGSATNTVDTTSVASAPDFSAAAEHYRKLFVTRVGKAAFHLDQGEQQEDVRYLDGLRSEGKIKLDHPQFLVLVNVLGSRQTVALWMMGPGGDPELIGVGRTSSGNHGRFDHHLSPNGIFENLSSNGNFRALGTKNENGIRGYGEKGLRVFDLGWQDSYAGWGKHQPTRIRLQMHSTDPTYMESRLGRPDSEGCTRIHQNLNRFFDQEGVLDQDFEENGPSWVLSPKKDPSPYSGRYVIIHRWDGHQELPTESERDHAL